MSLVEFSLDLLLSWDWALHPRMGEDLAHGWPVRALELKHALDEVLELLTEVGFLAWLVLAMSPPEDVSSVGSQASVEWVIWLGSGEWWVLGDHDEQNNC